MKAIELTANDEAILDLLKCAQEENLLLRTPDGQEYVLAELGDFDREIELTRNNQDLMRLLDERGKEKATVLLEELKRELGL